MIRSPAGFDGGDRIKRYLDYYQPSYGVMMLSAGQFSPAQLFAQGEQGAWYDPSDLTTMFQDAAGTTPVTAVGQAVGLILDKSGNNNHASQTTSTSRPTLSARVNLLTYSEQFNNAAWTKSGTSISATNTIVAPDGTTTAETVVISATNAPHIVENTTGVTVLANQDYIASVCVKKNTQQYVTLGFSSAIAAYNYAVFDLDAGLVTQTSTGTGTAITSTSCVSLGNSWYRITLVSRVPGTTAYFDVTFSDSATPTISSWAGPSFSGNGTSSFYIWGADLRTSNQPSSLPTYQRIAAATDYDTTGFPLFLSFDGTDDGLVTSAINFSGTDKMSVFAGLRKLRDAARGTVVELTASAAANNGAFHLAAPNAASATMAFESKGTALTDAVASSLTAPLTRVVTGLGDISGDTTTIRVNAVQADQDTGDQGTGNYSNAILYIGRRGGTTLPFNGNLYGLIVRGAVSSSTDISSAETWMATKTGVTL